MAMFIVLCTLGVEDFVLGNYSVVMNRDEYMGNQQQQAGSRLAVSDFKAVIQTAEGRRFLRWLLAECGVHHGSFASDGMVMAFREGRRSVGLWVQSLFVDFPDQYLRLLKEQVDDVEH